MSSYRDSRYKPIGICSLIDGHHLSDFGPIGASPSLIGGLSESESQMVGDLSREGSERSHADGRPTELQTTIKELIRLSIDACTSGDGLSGVWQRNGETARMVEASCDGTTERILLLFVSGDDAGQELIDVKMAPMCDAVAPNDTRIQSFGVPKDCADTRGTGVNATNGML